MYEELLYVHYKKLDFSRTMNQVPGVLCLGFGHRILADGGNEKSLKSGFWAVYFET